MGYTDPQTVHNPATGGIAPASWGDTVRDDLEFLVDPPGFAAEHSTTENVATSTYVVLSADTETYDTDAMHSTVTNTSRGTVVTAGKYSCAAVVQKPDTNSTNRCVARFLVNGTTAYSCSTLGSASYWTQSIERVIDLAVGDYVEVQVWQDSGGTRLFQLLQFSMLFVAR